MKKTNIILSFLYLVFLLSACNSDEDTNSNGTPSPQASNPNQISTNPNSPPSEIKTMRINQDLIILNENTEDSYPTYYENNKCTLKNITGRAKLKGEDPWAKKQLKKNETYKAFGFRLTYSNRAEYVVGRRPIYQIDFTIYFMSETPESVYLRMDCSDDEATPITSPADIEKLLDNVISFVDEEGSMTENLNMFGPSSSKASRLIGSKESVALKKIHLNDDEFTEYYENEKCDLSVYGSAVWQVYHYEHYLYYISLYKGQDEFLTPFYPYTLKIVFRNDFGIYTDISCKGDDLTLSTSPSDIEKLLDNKLSFH